MKNNHYSLIAPFSFFALLLLGLLPAQAQNSGSCELQRRCRQAMSQSTFAQKKLEVTYASGLQRLQVANRIARNNCFSSLQVKEIAQLLQRDFHRFVFARRAFRRTVDQRNFGLVSPAFDDYSYASRLKRIINFQGGGTDGGGGFGGGGDDRTDGTLIDNRNYQRIYQSIVGERTSKLFTAQRLLRTERKKMSTDQIRKITQLFECDLNRLQFLRFAYRYAHRKSDYYQLTNLLESTFHQQALLNSIRNG